MTSTSVSHPSSSDQYPRSNTIEIAVPGRTFHYSLTAMTERCFVLEAAHTGAVRQFGSELALIDFLRGLRIHLEHKYNREVMADALREEAREAMYDRAYPFGQGL